MSDAQDNSDINATAESHDDKDHVVDAVCAVLIIGIAVFTAVWFVAHL